MPIGIRDPRESHYCKVIKVKTIFMWIEWNCSPLIPSKQKENYVSIKVYANILLCMGQYQ